MSEQQRAAVALACAGDLCLRAGPGAGKTSMLCEIYKALRALERDVVVRSFENGKNPSPPPLLQLNGHDRFSARDPSGTCNFSRINNATLHLTLTVATVASGRSAKLLIYAVTYNVLRITSGIGGDPSLIGEVERLTHVQAFLRENATEHPLREGLLESLGWTPAMQQLRPSTLLH